MKKRFGALSSVKNPQELSLTVQSGIKLLVSVLLSLGIFTTTQADTVLEQIPVIVTAGLATWEAVNMAWGAIRKVIYKFYPETE